MKTLKQIKNDYVRDNYLASHDLDTWFEFQNYFASRHPEWFEQHWEEVMKIYAMECLKLASESEFTFSKRESLDSDWIVYVKKESITNENNIIK